MKLPVYLDRVSDLRSKNRLLKLSVVCLVLTQALLTYAVVQALRYQRTVLVPMRLRSATELTAGRVSEDYIRECARDVASLALNVTPGTARRNFEDLLAHYSPKTCAEGKRALYQMAKNIEDGKISGAFYPQEIAADTQAGLVRLTGHRKVFSDDLLVESAKKTYVLRYELVDGEFQLLGFAPKEQEKELEKSIREAPAPAQEGLE